MISRIFLYWPSLPYKTRFLAEMLPFDSFSTLVIIMGHPLNSSISKLLKQTFCESHVFPESFYLHSNNVGLELTFLEMST